MANQYTGSFVHIVEKKFNCSAEKVLQKFSDDGLTYQEAEKLLGFKHGTIRKWANRFNIKLKSSGIVKSLKTEDNMKRFKEKAINKYNVLSRRWFKRKSFSF